MDTFRWAALHYPERKALGADGWRAHELGMLPDSALQRVVDIINQFVTQGQFPQQLGLNIMTLLPKPSGGYRTIAKTPMWHRLYAFARRKTIKAWENRLFRLGTRQLPTSLL